MPTSPHGEIPRFVSNHGEFVTCAKADVAIGPYEIVRNCARKTTGDL